MLGNRVGGSRAVKLGVRLLFDEAAAQRPGRGQTQAEQRLHKGVPGAVGPHKGRQAHNTGLVTLALLAQQEELLDDVLGRLTAEISCKHLFVEVNFAQNLLHETFVRAELREEVRIRFIVTLLDYPRTHILVTSYSRYIYYTIIWIKQVVLLRLRWQLDDGRLPHADVHLEGQQKLEYREVLIQDRIHQASEAEIRALFAV